MASALRSRAGLQTDAARAHHLPSVDLSSVPPASLRRCFLSWDHPLLPQAVSLLAGEWDGPGPLELSDVLVIVPTRQSGRRLREALADHAAQRGAGVFAPRVMLPESLVAPATDVPVANRAESLLAWVDVFRDLKLQEFREVFPVDPPERAFGWALRLAQQFVELQRTLAESGLQLRDVAPRVGTEFPELERWRQIGVLEAAQERRLTAAGVKAAPAARLARARSPELPDGVRRVVVLGTPDPQPLALRALAALADKVPVEIVIHAPAAEADTFDAWGRPLAQHWATRKLVLPHLARRVHVCPDPEAQAARIGALAAVYRSPEGLMAVGVADPEVLPLLQSELTEAGLPVFSPEGHLRRGDRLYPLLQACAALASDDAFRDVEALARCPDFLEYLRTKLGGGFAASAFLQNLDELRERHLPATLREAQRQAERHAGAITSDSPGSEPNSVGTVRSSGGPLGALAPALRVVGELRGLLTSGQFPANAAETLAMVFQKRTFDGSAIEDVRLAEAAGEWNDVLRDLAGAGQLSAKLSAKEAWELALRLYAESVSYDDKPAGAMELQGWLELLWEDAPHLVVAGLNDGCVPEAIVGHAFLPESLREKLGLKTNAQRFARDAYLLQAIAAWRNSEGAAVPRGADASAEVARLDLLLGKTSVAGDPLRPSRLLFRCADEELPDRVRLFFQPVVSSQTTQAWRRAWKLAPRRAPPPTRVAVTALRAWLACPFRFYLKKVLRMEAVEPGKTELDVFDFGTLCHSALEAMGREAALRHTTDPKALRDFLLGRLELEAARRFGADLALPLVVQLESARQRLARVAEIQAQSRGEGWVIEQVERPFAIEVGGLTVAGKIDRIDRHEGTGALRVLDYKTSDRPVAPEDAHLRGIKRVETAPDFARLTCGKKPRVWIDLQLPLYLRALQMDATILAGAAGAATPSATIHCGYFNLPKSIAETGILQWEGYTRELDDAAWQCATGVATAIRQGVFWPPDEALRSEQDEFGSLFPHGVADSVQWEALP